MMKLSGKVGKFGKRGIAVVAVVTTVLGVPVVHADESVSKSASKSIPEASLPAGVETGSVTATITYTIGYGSSSNGTIELPYESLSVCGGGSVTPPTLPIYVIAGSNAGCVPPTAEKSGIGSATTDTMIATRPVLSGGGALGLFHGARVTAVATAAGISATASHTVIDLGEVDR